MCWCVRSGAVGWGVEVRAVCCRLVRAAWCRVVRWLLSSAESCRVETCHVERDEACVVENRVCRFEVCFAEGLVWFWAQECPVERAVWCRVEKCLLDSLHECLL